MNAILVNALAIRDALAHTYTTDKLSIAGGRPVLNNPYIAIVRTGAISDRKHLARTYALYISNGLNQSLTIQAIGNVDNTGTKPDYNIGSSFTVAASAAGASVFPYDQYASEFVSASISAAAAPTAGTVSGYIYFYM